RPLAAQEHVTQGTVIALQLPWIERHQLAGDRCGIEHGNAVIANGIQQWNDRGPWLLCNHQTSAGKQCTPYLPEGRFRTAFKGQIPRVLGTELEPFLTCADKPGDVGVRKSHSLR